MERYAFVAGWLAPGNRCGTVQMCTAEPKPVCPILMGSAANMDRCQKIASALEEFGIDAELRIASAHKVPERLLGVIAAYNEDPRPKVFIAVAGLSNALSGVLDCAGAALMAAKILGIENSSVRDAVSELQRRNREKLFIDDSEATSATLVSLIQEKHRANQVITDTDLSQVLGATDKKSGKVRDQYVVGDKLYLVTTDRQSAFDRVLAAIPFKGQVLNLAAAWWFKKTEHIIPNHVIDVPHPYVTIARKCSPFPIEFIVRGYITGSTDTSLWTYYARGERTYCGIEFPDGLRKNQKLDKNVLTPTTKEEYGDKPISQKEIVAKGLMTQEDFDVCAKAAMELFAFGQEVAAENGLILVDTKYEFGKDADGTIRVIDEIHTPDSSRFWLRPTYAKRFAAGEAPDNVDKDFLRLWFKDRCDPYRDRILPEAPEDLVVELARRYIMLYQLTTGDAFDASAASPVPEELKRALSS